MTPSKHKQIPTTFAVVFCVLLVGCGYEDAQPSGNDSGPSMPPASNDQNSPPIDEASVAKVKVLVDGTILLDDNPITVDELKTAFTELKEKNGAVWYYRENGAGEPPPEAMTVMNAVVNAKLPITLSTKPDFSDCVGQYGN